MEFSSLLLPTRRLYFYMMNLYSVFNVVFSVTSLQTKDQDLESKDYAIPHGNLEVSDYQIVRHGQSSTISNCVVDTGAIEFDLMENFVNKVTFTIISNYF